MNKKLAIIISLTIIILNILPVRPSFSTGELTLPDAIKEFMQDKKRQRIAVMDFINTEGTKTRFDGFIADSIISELSKYPITLLERKRLELLLKEHELSHSGLIDSEKAVKLGVLLPVDIIVSGSYTEIQGKIIINGRFINVSTGEILYAFTSSIININAETAKPETEKDKCASDSEEVEKSLANLRTESSINSAVDTAIKIPFSGDCGRIHYKVTNTFKRHKIFPQKYKSFLIESLNGIEDPSDDSRANEIIRYFASDESVDPEEWKASVDALKRMRLWALNMPIGYMLNNTYEESDLVKNRSDEIIKLSIDGKIGRPVAIPAEDILISLLNGLKSYKKEGDMEAPAYVFDKYQNLMPDNEKYNKKATGLIENMYLSETNREIQKKILNVMIEFYKSREKSDALAEELADFMRSLNLNMDDRYEKNKDKRKAYLEDIKILNKSLEDPYCVSLDNAIKKNYPYIVEERTLYILRNNMKCGYASSIKDLETDMRSKDWEKKLKAIEILSKIGEAARGAEKTIIVYLGQQGYSTQGGKLRSLCAKTLGNIRTKDPKAIQLLIESFPDYEGASHEAEEAIEKIGPVAIPYLIKGLEHKHHAVRLRCAKALGNHGAKAKEAVPILTKISQSDDNPYVRKQAEEAVQMIKNDF